MKTEITIQKGQDTIKITIGNNGKIIDNITLSNDDFNIKLEESEMYDYINMILIDKLREDK